MIWRVIFPVKVKFFISTLCHNNLLFQQKFREIDLFANNSCIELISRNSLQVRLWKTLLRLVTYFHENFSSFSLVLKISPNLYFQKNCLHLGTIFNFRIKAWTNTCQAKLQSWTADWLIIDQICRRILLKEENLEWSDT